MAASTRACAINKCEISSCAICHCCQRDLCLDHLKEHKDQLNTQLTPLANQINVLLDDLEHFTPNSLPSFNVLEQWRTAAHQTVDRFYEHLHHELFEQKKNTPVGKLRIIRNDLDQLIRKQGATRENIKSLTDGIRLIEEEINGLRNIQINLRPLVIDDKTIIQSTSPKRTKSNEAPRAAPAARQTEPDGFQILVQMPFKGNHIFIWVNPQDTILEVKKKIENREGFPPNQQILTLMGKQLMDTNTIATYGIRREQTIKLSYSPSNEIST